MKRAIPELLAPAGGMAQFNAALAAGADAIYCGFGNTFNARRGAESFTSKTFSEACKRAHVVGVRVYVTVNVAIREDEMPSVLALVRRAWLCGADAFIIQDWGLLYEVHNRWPDIECHVSTQANVHDARGVAWCKGAGASRVTLSRELSIGEIALIARQGVDLECFCHGAICICYSGVCQMSSSSGNRSANRGTCAQPCRLPYDLVDERGESLIGEGSLRPLCPKDFYSFDDLADLMGTGVRSLKVEGRLKGSEYLASVITAYREQLDDLSGDNTPSYNQLSDRRRRLKRAFNRDFTNAYLRGTSNNELMSYERSNNRGEIVGTVVDARSYGSVKVRRGGNGGGRERLRTKHVAEVEILLKEPVFKGDLLEIRPLSDSSQFLTTNAMDDARPGQSITCRTTRAMERDSVVRLIRSKSAMDLGARYASLEIPRKRDVLVSIRARLGEPFLVSLMTADGKYKAEARGFVVEAALTRSVTKDDLVEHVGRMGATPFEAVSYEVALDEGCGMGFSAVHEVRKRACKELEKAIFGPYENRQLSATPSPEVIRDDCSRLLSQTGAIKRDPEVCAIVSTLESAISAREAGASRVYASADVLSRGKWPEWVIPCLDEVCREKDHERLDPWVRRGKSVAVGNVSELALAKERGAAAEIRNCIPVHNRSCLAALREAGASAAWLSAELSLKEIALVSEQVSMPLGLVVFGRTRTMTTEHCVLQVANACIHDCDACALRLRSAYLQNDAKEKYPVRTDLQGRSRIYSACPLDLTPNISELVSAGISRFAADCTLLTSRGTADAVRHVGKAVQAARQNRHFMHRWPGYTSGHLLEPVT